MGKPGALKLIFPLLAWLFLFLALYFSSSSASAIDPSQSPDVNQSSSQPFQVVEESPYRAYCVETGAQLEISVVVSKRSSPLASISIIFPDVSRSEFIPENLSERKYGITFIPETEGRYDVEFSSGQPGQRVETVYFYAYPPGSDPVELGYRCTNIKGRNKPPVLITDISDISFEEGHNATLNLSGNFRDSDKDALVFTSSPSDSVIVSFQGSIATVSALQGFAGSEHIVFYASDGRSIVPSNTVTVMVGPAQSNISENASVSTVQYEARTGQPVRWKKTVSLASPQSVSVYIPASASVISIRDSANGNDLGPGAVKPSRWQDQKIVDISEPVTELEVLYETPGPASEERNTGKRSKEVLISSDIHYENISANASLPVEIPSAELATLAWHVSSEEGLPKNSLSRAEISELEQNGVLVKEVPFTARDTNGNGLLDAIEWIVPSLSNQTYEISISVLNIHSHPTLYGNWAVEFITLGEANLTVTATNEPNYTSEYTRWSDSLEENYDLKFLELRCGNETFQYQWLGSDCLSEECSVFAENYSCNETSYETSKVLSAKKHVLKFQFGDEAVYAYNDAANITLNSITLNSTYGANTTRENLTIYVNATDAEGDNISIAYDWRLNGSSIAVLNMNFDVNNSAGAGKTRDYSSYENNGTVTDAVWSATGGWNGTGAYSYGSTGSYIDAGSSQSLNITGKEITLEAWVYHASNPDNDGIIFKGPLTNSQGTYSLVYVNNVYFRLNGAIVEGSGQVGTSDGPYANNVWHHLVATYDGADQRIYVDGIQKNSQPYTSDIGDSGADSLKIGTYYSTGYPFGGNIDNINIYDRALSPQEITAHYQNRSDLMVSQELAAGQNWTVCATPNDGSADGTTNCSSALYAQSGAPSINSIILNSTLGANTTQENLTVYVNATDLNNDPVRFAYDWRLNGSSIAILNMNFDVNNSAGAGKTRDYTMFGNNGTVNGATWNATGGWNGTGGYLFSSGNITVPDNDDLEFDKPFSITGWVNPSDISSQFVNYLVTKGSGSASGFYLGFVGSDASTCGGVDGAVYIWNGSSLFCSNTTLTTDAWTFIAATFNGSNTSIYIDGILENSDNAIVYGANAYNLLLGIRNDGSWQYNGYMDQFAYWNRSLTSQEVSALYQNRSDSVVSQELAAGQDWAVCATPNDGILDGATNCSNTLLIRTYENCTDTGGTWTISSNYILNRSVECFSIIVTNNAVLTIDSSPTGANGPVNLSADAVVVEAGSRISADARGYGPGLGPGAGTNRTSGQGTSGGGHGGTGGTGLALTAGGTPYGNITIPTTLGSGGGSISSAYAGSGGGAIFINASRIQVDGIITANGTSGNHSAVGSGTGGGSGGSIWLITENMSGSGTIRADGGRGSTYSGGGYHGGGGAGGRIAIYYSSSSFDGTITAFGGYSGKQYGGAGTVLLVPGSGAGFLVIDNGFPSTSVAYTPWNSSYPVFDNLNVSGGAVLFCNNTPLAVSSDIIVLANSSIAGFPNISVANLTVESQALINSSGLGYGPGLGPGAGANGSCCGGGTGGGGYGGNGGNGLNDYAGGPAYGDVIAPYEIGSGGGAVGDGTGGIGGGKIVISVSERLALEGAIHAEGLNSSHYSTWAQGTGGGSGGSVWITASELNGTGTISVAGAKGSTYSGGGYWGGGGSGGRVSVSYVTNTFSGLVNLSGGSSGYRNGSAGTFFYCSRISNFSSCQDGFGKTLHSVFASNSSQNITRKLYVEWTNDSMMWNESSTNASTVAQYIVYNLTPSASYAIAANGVVLATQSANSSGALGPFTINLSSEQQISLTNVPQVISCIGATASFTCGQNVNESCTMNGDLNATGTNCFNVTASNVSINCAGFTISGNNTFNTQGVYTTVFNTSVRNCNINGFDVGIYYNGATAINGTIENNNVNTSVNNWVDPTYSSAILLRGGASFNTLNNNIANSHYGKGILLYGSCNSNTLTNVTGRNIASGAAGYGIQVSTNSNNNHFIGVSASANQSSGIYIDGGSNAFIDCAGGLIEGTNTSNTWGVYTNQFNTTIKNCNINGFDVGIYYNGAHNGTIENNNINVTVNNYVNPTYSTAILLYGAHFNTLNNNIAYSKDGIGIFLATASNNTVLNNSGVSNSKAGFALYVNSNGNQIIDSKGISTGSYGFFSHSSSNNIITNSNGTTGAVGGFYFTDNSNNNTILNSTGTSGAEGGIYVAGSSNNKIINSTGTAGTYGNLYLQVSDNNSIEGSTFLSSTSYSVFVYSGSDNNTFTNCQISGKNNAYGALLIYASNYDNTIANSTINGLGATYAASLQAGTFTGNIFINNTFLNATNLLLFDAGASNNIICLNNFSDSGTSPTTYITDSNGSNFYSCTYDGKNQGNIYPNVLNGSVEIKGSVNSSIGGLYIGASGAGYPYNSTNSLGKMIGGVDSAPLTAAFISPLLSEIIAPQNNSVIGYANGTLNVAVNYTGSGTGCNATISAGTLAAVGNATQILGTITTGNSTNFTLNLTDAANLYGLNYNVSVNTTCAEVQSFQQISIFVDHTWSITNNFIDQTGTISNVSGYDVGDYVRYTIDVSRSGQPFNVAGGGLLIYNFTTSADVVLEIQNTSAMRLVDSGKYYGKIYYTQAMENSACAQTNCPIKSDAYLYAPNGTLLDEQSHGDQYSGNSTQLQVTSTLYNYSLVNTSENTILNLSVYDSNSSINWSGSELRLAGASPLNLDSAVILSSGFAYVNSSSYPGLNHTSYTYESLSAIITMNGVGCSQGRLFYGVSPSREAILSSGTACNSSICINQSCTNSTVTFTVLGFSGYAYGTNSNLSIWDTTESDPASVNQTVRFFANYSNASGAPIIGAECNFSDNNNGSFSAPAVMAYNSTSTLYESNKSFPFGGTFTFNVSCYNAAGLDNLTANDTFHIIPCGDSVCNASLGEDCHTCPQDCGECPPLQACECDSCASCVSALNNDSCTTVNLTMNITAFSSCIKGAVNFSAKTFDCQNHSITALSTGIAGFNLSNLANPSIINCPVSYFSNGILLNNVSNFTMRSSYVSSNLSFPSTGINSTSSTAKLYSNYICNNTQDLYSVDWGSSYGEENGCDEADGWSEDVYTHECTYYCIFDDTEPTVQLNYPESDAQISSYPIRFNITADDNVARNMSCSLLINGTVVSTRLVQVLTPTLFNYSFYPSMLGGYDWKAICKDRGRNRGNASALFNATPGVCECYDKSTCESALNSSVCLSVILRSNVSQSGTFISYQSNFNNKTFDCENNWVNGTGTGYGIELKENNSRNTISNCIISNFNYSVYSHPSVLRTASSYNTFSNLTLANSYAGMYFDLLNANGYSNISFNNITGVHIANCTYGVLAQVQGSTWINNFSSNTFTGLTVLNSTNGVYLYVNNFNYLDSNSFRDSTFSGATYAFTYNYGDSDYLDSNEIANSTIENSTYGIYITGAAGSAHYNAFSGLSISNVTNAIIFTCRSLNCRDFSVTDVLIANSTTGASFSNCSNLVASNLTIYGFSTGLIAGNSTITVNSSNISSGAVGINASGTNLFLYNDDICSNSAYDIVSTGLGSSYGVNNTCTLFGDLDYPWRKENGSFGCSQICTEPVNPPQIVLNYPENGGIAAYYPIQFNFTATDDNSQEMRCGLVLYNWTEAVNDTVQNATPAVMPYYGSPGYYYWKIDCYDEGYNKTSSDEWNFTAVSGVCECYDKSTCESALNSSVCTSVILRSNVSQSGTFISYQSNFNNKTFDCENNWVNGTGTGYGIELKENNSRNTISNCIISNFNYSVYSHPSVLRTASSYNTFSNLTLANSYAGMYFDLLNANGYSNISFNNITGVHIANCTYGVLAQVQGSTWVNNFSSNTFTGLTVLNSTNGVYLYVNNHNYLDSNSFRDSTFSGATYAFTYNYGDSDYLDSNEIANSTIENSTYGIYITGAAGSAHYNAFSGLSISNVTNAIIFTCRSLNCRDFSVTDVLIANSTTGASFSNCSDLNITNLTAYNSPTGILARNSTIIMRFSNISSGTVGINLSGTDFYLYDNSVCSNSAYDIFSLGLGSSYGVNNTCTLFGDLDYPWRKENGSFGCSQICTEPVNPPQIVLNYPENGGIAAYYPIQFNFTATDDNSATMRCGLVLYNWTQSINDTSQNATPTLMPYYGSPGYYYWKIDCYDEGYNKTSSEERNFTAVPGVCECYDKSTCESALNSSVCLSVILKSNVSQSGTFISYQSNFNNKTFDCENNWVNGTGTGYGIELKENNSRNTISNCIISNFNYSVYSHPSVLRTASSYNTFSNLTLANSYAGMYFDLLNASGYSNISFNNITGVHIANCTYGVLAQVEGETWVNNFSSNTFTGLTVLNSTNGVYLYMNYNNYITLNSFRDSTFSGATYAFRANYGDSDYLDSNEIANSTVENSAYGIYITGANGAAHYNAFSGLAISNVTNGLLFACRNLDCQNFSITNVLINNSETGAYFANCSNLEISNLTQYDAITGVLLLQSTASIYDSSLSWNWVGLNTSNSSLVLRRSSLCYNTLYDAFSENTSHTASGNNCSETEPYSLSICAAACAPLSQNNVSIASNSPADGEVLVLEDVPYYVLFNVTPSNSIYPLISKCRQIIDGTTTFTSFNITSDQPYLFNLSGITPVANHSWFFRCRDELFTFNNSETRNFSSQYCICHNKSTCEAALNSTSCFYVLLRSNVSQSGTFISYQSNFNNKTFDCENNWINGTGTGYGIELEQGNSYNTIKNCMFSNFNYSLYTHFPASNSAASYNTFSNLTITNSNAGMYFNLYDLAGNSNSSNNNMLDISIANCTYGVLTQVEGETWINSFSNNTFRGGSLSNTTYGIYFFLVNNNRMDYITLEDITIADSVYGIYLNLIGGMSGTFNNFTLSQISLSRSNYSVYYHYGDALSGHRLNDITISNSTYGVLISPSGANQEIDIDIRRLSVEDSEYGVRLINSTGISLDDCAFSNNTYGIYATNSSILHINNTLSIYNDYGLYSTALSGQADTATNMSYSTMCYNNLGDIYTPESWQGADSARVENQCDNAGGLGDWNDYNELGCTYLCPTGGNNPPNVTIFYPLNASGIYGLNEEGISGEQAPTQIYDMPLNISFLVLEDQFPTVRAYADIISIDEIYFNRAYDNATVTNMTYNNSNMTDGYYYLTVYARDRFRAEGSQTVRFRLSQHTCTCYSCEECNDMSSNSSCEIIILGANITSNGSCTNMTKTFDCENNTITGNGTGYGVHAYNNATIYNCTIMNYTWGVYSNASNNSVLNCNLLYNTQGMYLLDNGWARILNSVFLRNSIGVNSSNSASNITSNRICFNTQDLYSADWLSSAGRNNTCDSPDGWNDTGISGCARPCDDQPPAVELLAPPDQTNITIPSANLSFRAIDGNSTLMNCTVRVSDSVFGQFEQNVTVQNNTPYNITLSSLSNGSHYWNASCSDEAGNSNTSETWVFRVNDISGPIITQLSPEDGTVFGSPGVRTLSWYATDDISSTMTCQVYLNGSVINTTSAANGTITYTNTTSLGRGAYIWNIACVDESGNPGAGADWHFYVDQSGPLVSLISPPDAHVFNATGTKTLTWNASDDYSPNMTCNVHLNGTLISTTTIANHSTANTTTSSLAQGIYLWNVTCTDLGDNTNSSATWNFTIDTEPPHGNGTLAISLVAPGNSSHWRSDALNFSWYAEDNFALVPVCDLYVDSGIAQSSVPSPNGTVTTMEHGPLSEGAHAWNVSCEDDALNRAYSPVWSFFIDPPAGDVNISLISPSDTYVFNTTGAKTLVWNATDDYSPNMTCNVSLNGTVFNTTVAPNNTNMNTATPALSESAYYWNVSCSDLAGNSGGSATWSFAIDTAGPVVNLVSPPHSHVTNISTLTFNWTASDANDPLMNCTLRIDDVPSGTAEIANGSTSAITLSNLTQTIHNWNVSCIDDWGNTGWSETWQFRIVSPFEPEVIQISPADGRTFNYSGPKDLLWNVSDDLDTTLLCNVSLNGTVFNTTNAPNGTTINTSTPALGQGVYIWNVACIDGSGNVGTGFDWTFTIDTNDSNDSLVSLVSPADGTAFNSTGVKTLTWNVTDDYSATENCTIYLNNSAIFSGSVSTGVNINTDTSALSEGLYYWNATCTDLAGWAGYSETWSFTIDTSAPTVNLSSPADGNITISTTIAFQWNATDTYDPSLECSIYLDGILNGTNSTLNGSSSLTVHNISYGAHSWNVSCIDDANNTGWSETWQFIVAAPFAPTVTLISPPDAATFNYSGPKNLTWSVNYSVGPTTCGVYLNGTEISSLSAPNNAPVTNETAPLSQGAYSWNVNCTDALGNNGTSLLWTFIIDTNDSNDSIVSLVSPADGTAFNSTGVKTLTWNVTDDYSATENCTIYLNNSAIFSGSVSTGVNINTDTSALSEGSYYWNATCTDLAGWAGYSETWSFTIDTAGPEVSLIRPQDRQVFSSTGNKTLEWNATDSAYPLNCTVYLDSEPISNASVMNDSAQSTVTRRLGEGRYYWNASCTDPALSTGWSQTWSFRIDDSGGSDYCGNGHLVTPGEECEVGHPLCIINATEFPTWICDTSTCKCHAPEPRCGDLIINQSNESCEPGAVPCTNSSWTCNADCTCSPPKIAPRCGDLIINQPNESCEPGAVPCANSSWTCNADCTCSAPPEHPYCGDGRCSNGENCTTCPQDCGRCPCSSNSDCPADQMCSNGECIPGLGCQFNSPPCGECFMCLDNQCVDLVNHLRIDAPLESLVNNTVTVALYNISNSTIQSAYLNVTDPLNISERYLSDANGRIFYLPPIIGYYTYSSSCANLTGILGTYVYDTQSQPSDKILIIPLYVTEPSKLTIDVVSMGKPTKAGVKADEPNQKQKTSDTDAYGRYEETLTVPGKYVYTISASNVRSLAANIQLTPLPASRGILDDPNLLILLIILLLLILLSYKYRDRIVALLFGKKAAALSFEPEKPVAGEELAITLRDEKGGPLRNKKLIVVGENGEVAELKTDSKGSASFIPPAKGTYIFSFRDAEIENGKVEVG